MTEHKIQGIEAIAKFVLAGNAHFTLRNTAKDTRLTFKFSKPKKVKDTNNVPVFAAVLTGPDNTAHYSFLGTIWQSKKVNNGGIIYNHSAKSKIGEDAPSAATVDWLIQHIAEGRELPASVEFYHAGKCGRCGRPLTVPESIESGIGPICEGL